MQLLQRLCRVQSKETGEVFEEANGGQSEAGELIAGGLLPMASVVQYLFHNCLFPVKYHKQHLLLVGCSNDAISAGRRSYQQLCFDEF